MASSSPVTPRHPTAGPNVSSVIIAIAWPPATSTCRLEVGSAGGVDPANRPAGQRPSLLAADRAGHLRPNRIGRRRAHHGPSLVRCVERVAHSETGVSPAQPSMNRLVHALVHIHPLHRRSTSVPRCSSCRPLFRPRRRPTSASSPDVGRILAAEFQPGASSAPRGPRDGEPSGAPTRERHVGRPADPRSPWPRRDGRGGETGTRRQGARRP